MCVALLFSSCTKEALGTEANEPTLQTTVLSSSITSTSDYSDLMIQLADEPEEKRVRKQDCTCYLKVIKVENSGGLSWSLLEILNGAEYFGISGVGDTNTPSAYHQLSDPSQGDHLLEIVHEGYPQLNISFKVSVICVDENFALANYYLFDLTFSEGSPFTPPESFFNIYTSCNSNDGGNTGS